MYATEHFGGLGLRSLPVEHGAQHIIFILGNLRENNDNATAIFMLLESFSIGTTQNPMNDNRDFSYVSAPWLETAREFMKETAMHITIPQLQTINLYSMTSK